MKHERRVFFLPVLVLLNLVLLCSRAEATAFTVKAGGGGNFTTISACANAAGAGDTCTVFAGSTAVGRNRPAAVLESQLPFKPTPGTR